MKNYFRQSNTKKWLIIATACVTLFFSVQWLISFFETKYTLENGRYLYVHDYQEEDNSGYSCDFLIENDSGVITFIDPNYGDIILQGKLKDNKLKAHSKKCLDMGLSYDYNYSTPKKFIMWATRGNINLIFTPFTETNLNGKLIADNRLSGNYSGIDWSGDYFKGNFLLLPSGLKSKKKLYPKLPVGNGHGVKMLKNDPRGVGIQLVAPQTYKIYDNTIESKELSDIIKQQSFKFGNDIPIYLYIDKNINFLTINPLIKLIEKQGLYRVKICYFHNKRWDGMTLISFDLPDPKIKVEITEEGFQKHNTLILSCLPDHQYTLTPSLEIVKKQYQDNLEDREVRELTATFNEPPRIITFTDLKKVMRAIHDNDPEINFLLEFDDNLTLNEVMPLINFLNCRGVRRLTFGLGK